MKKLVGFVAAVAFAFSLSLGSVHARPNYMKAFTEAYPNVKDAATAKCAVCHGPTDKKVRNDYGKAVGAALGEPKVTDAAKISAALKKAEENPTFGDKLKAGKLPCE
jgi:mono/diheme cytochrome c family protein